ncbi:DUF1707 SHOCT-like domain-containing protein [Spelaeicoccus albus]|uniref:DUF1707 domain-containing protein n=1 Tax=Spelaeicoccus albus TaxID=1280376 RepID=A0A7Z0A7N6_9MICO|nr:DUF1707 domain-containing protein [Spelaeicoccus albus]NYI65939.1 hypothetical protein [Spelaeicoccus albus]
MTEASSGDVWSRLSRDPRDPSAASLRASDRDRDAVAQELADAFADGRLDREEYDERSDAVLRAKTLGDFPPILADLSPADGTPVPAKPSHDFQSQAERDYKRSFRQRLSGAIGSSAITTGIWGASSMASGHLVFFWPVFVVVGTGVGVVTTLLNKGDQIDARREQLEQKADRKAMGSGADPDDDSYRHGPYGPGWNGPHGAWSGLTRDERRQRARDWRDNRR